MSIKRVTVGQFTADGELTYDTSEWKGCHVTMFFNTGGFGGGTIAIEAGDKDGTAPVMVQSFASGALHTPCVVTLNCNLTIAIICDQLKFIMTGSVSPAVHVDLFPECP